MSSNSTELWNRELERLVREALQSIRFGTVSLVVQDGRVIQVDRNEKIRINRNGHIDGSGI
ncbi:MAG: YezD family protein [Desulfuromonadaceae bacterium]